MNKIGYVLTSFPVLSETFVSTEMRAMQGCGHQVQPIAFDHYDGEYQAKDESLKAMTLYLCDFDRTIALKALRYLSLSLSKGMFKGLQFAFKQQGLSFKSLLLNALKLAYVARQTGCTHLHAHFAHGAAAMAIVAARLCGISVSFVGHGYDIYATPSDLALKLDSVDFAVAVCLDMAMYFQSLAPKTEVSLVYCGVDTQRFSYTKALAPAIKDKKEQKRSGKLLFIGRLCETKGLFTLLDALRQIDPNIRPQVDFVGDGVLREGLVDYIAEHQLGDHVSLLGSRQSSWLIGNANQYDAMVVPFEMASNGDRDTGPVVVKEAMSLKLPVISTYFMGCKEMLTEETGLRVPPNDSVGLAAEITRFLNMSMAEVSQMVENAYERVTTHYSADVQALCLSAMVERT